MSEFIAGDIGLSFGLFFFLSTKYSHDISASIDDASRNIRNSAVVESLFNSSWFLYLDFLFIDSDLCSLYVCYYD